MSTMLLVLEHKLSIVAKLFYTVHDVFQATMYKTLLGGICEHRRIPAFAQLFAGRHIDQAIVQMSIDQRHIFADEPTIHVDGVASQRTLFGLDVCLKEF